MKRHNDWIERVGTDKVLHLLGGFGIQAIIVSVATLLYGHAGYLCGSFVALFIVYALSILKEKWLDDYYDQLDIDFAMMGSISAVMFNLTAMVSVILIRLFL